jgi:hypothetical protein
VSAACWFTLSIPGETDGLILSDKFSLDGLTWDDARFGLLQSLLHSLLALYLELNPFYK